MQNSTQLRGIHQGLILYSQGNSGYYAGLDKSGLLAPAIAPSPQTPYVAAQKLGPLAMATLLNGNYFVPAYMVNPQETNPNIKTLDSTGIVTSANYSYAISKAGDPDADKGRVAEWRDNTNTQAAVLSDRVLKSGAEPGAQEAVPAAQQRSTWTQTDGDWRGSVVFGDNSTSFLTTSTLPKSKYADTLHEQDNLFEDAGADDAFQVRE